MPSSDKELSREDEEFLEKMATELDWCATWFPNLADQAHALRDSIIGVLRSGSARERLVAGIEVDEVEDDDAPFRVVSGVHRAHALSEMFRQGATLLENHAWVGAKGPWAIHARGEHNIGYVPEATSEAVAVEQFMNAHPRVVGLMQLREHEVTATRITHV